MLKLFLSPIVILGVTCLNVMAKNLIKKESMRNIHQAGDINDFPNDNYAGDYESFKSLVLDKPLPNQSDLDSNINIEIDTVISFCEKLADNLHGVCGF